MSEDMLVYPTEKVVGVVDDPQAIDGLRSALSDAGVAAGDVEVLSGDEGEARVDADGDDHGMLGRAVRRVQKVLGDEAERLGNLESELERGNLVVQVGLSEEDDDAREAEKQRIGKVLRTNGARGIAFYGKNQIEELTLDA